MKLFINSIIKSLVLLLGALTIALYAHAIVYSELNNDGGFYLGVAQQLSNGKVLYKDFTAFYTPFTFYFFSIIIRMFGSNLTIIYLSLFLVLFASAFLIYKIAGFFIKQNEIRLILACSYLLACYYYDGTYIYLEPFVNLFGLLSFLFVLKWREINRGKNSLLFNTGLFVSMSFLSKQYGLIYLGLCGLIIIFHSDSLALLIKGYMSLVLGFILPIIIITICFYLAGVTPKQLLGFVFRKSYANKSYSDYFISIANFLYINCLTFIFIPFIFIKFKKLNTFKIAPLISLIVFLVLFSTIYLVRQYAHYAMLLLPATFLIVAIIYSLIRSLEIKLLNYGFLILLTLTFTFYVKRAIQKGIDNNRDWNREGQIAVANEINEILPDDRKVLLFNNYELFFLSRINPVLENTYVFIADLNETEREDLIHKARCYFADRKAYSEYLKNINGQIYQINRSGLYLIKR